MQSKFLGALQLMSSYVQEDVLVAVNERLVEPLKDIEGDIVIRYNILHDYNDEGYDLEIRLYEVSSNLFSIVDTDDEDFWWKNDNSIITRFIEYRFQGDWSLEQELVYLIAPNTEFEAKLTLMRTAGIWSVDYNVRGYKYYAK